MKRRVQWLLVALCLPCLSAACDTTNGCEEALSQTRKLTEAVCREPPYDRTPFCSVCVSAGYLSTTGPTDCRCTLLAYDQGVCAIPSDDEAKSSIRGAIKWANESCESFSIGDAGAD